jgi:molybdenum cofactor biosynthesis enzyme MoaA
MSEHPLDTLQRPLRDLRISVTDRCNFRCVYCMPKEVFGRDHPFLPRHELLTFEELERAARLFTHLGVSKVRLTGGEPLLRRDLEVLVAMLARLPGLELTLTTNGSLLAEKAQRLHQAGLRRVSVSLDAIDDKTFMKMNDVDFPVGRVLEDRAAWLPGWRRSRSTWSSNAASTSTACCRWPSTFAGRGLSCASSSTWTSARPTAGAWIRSCRRPRS